MSTFPRLGLSLLSGGLYAAAGRQVVALGAPDVGLWPRFLFGAALLWAVTALMDWDAAPPAWLRAGVAGALLAAAIPLLPERLLGAAVVAATGEPLPPVAGRLLALLLAWSGVVVTAVAVTAALLWRAPPQGWRLPAVLFGLYGALLCSGSQLQSLTGDEPHYLLAARSLVVEGDLDLGSDYATGAWQRFYPSDLLRRSLQRPASLDPHDVPGPRGERLPIHQLGLSLLLAPGYALAGRHGALLVALLLGALAGWQAVRLAGRAPAGERFGGLAVALLSPLVAFSGSLHAEPAAAAAIAWLALLATAASVTARQRLGAAAVLAGLAWLHLKLLPVAALLTVYLTVDGLRRRERGAWLPLLGLLAGTVTQLGLFAWRYGSWSPSAPQLLAGGKYPVPFGGAPGIGLPGLWFDQQDGLAVVWPLALLALPGAVATWRTSWARRLLAVIGLHLLLIATYELWRSGFAPAGRQLLPIVPLLGPFVAAGATALPPRGRRLLPWLVGVNSALVLLGAWLPRLRYPVYQEGLVRQPLLARLGPLGEVWPAVGASDLATAAAWVYLGAWVALSVAAVRGKGSQA